MMQSLEKGETHPELNARLRRHEFVTLDGLVHLQIGRKISTDQKIR